MELKDRYYDYVAIGLFMTGVAVFFGYQGEWRLAAGNVAGVALTSGYLFHRQNRS